MKTINNAVISAIDKKETKETIATDNLKNNGSTPTFALVDLWRVQKKQKTLGSSTRW